MKARIDAGWGGPFHTNGVQDYKNITHQFPDGELFVTMSRHHNASAFGYVYGEFRPHAGFRTTNQKIIVEVEIIANTTEPLKAKPPELIR